MKLPTLNPPQRGVWRLPAAGALVMMLCWPGLAGAQLAVPNNPLTPRSAAPERDARPEGGLYIASDGFSFQVAAQRAMRQNPHGQRFFVLALPPHTRALTTQADRNETRLRKQVLAAGGVLLVCQRDVDLRRIDAASLVTEVVAVRGFPEPGSRLLPNDRRYFDGEDRSTLPADNEALRRLRSTCT